MAHVSLVIALDQRKLVARCSATPAINHAVCKENFAIPTNELDFIFSLDYSSAV